MVPEGSSERHLGSPRASLPHDWATGPRSNGTKGCEDSVQVDVLHSVVSHCPNYCWPSFY